jgi:hypothetical protein
MIPVCWGAGGGVSSTAKSSVALDTVKLPQPKPSGPKSIVVALTKMFPRPAISRVPTGAAVARLAIAPMAKTAENTRILTLLPPIKLIFVET